VPGVHCRLENISQSGHWIQSETFEVAGVLHSHEAGQSVGNTMQAWRRLRESEPSLFDGLRVWQSPTAFVDSVIYSWQQQEESARFENLLRQVDSLRTHWTDQAQERNFLSQTVQHSIPPGCTPLCQVTDTGFAMPGKAACREMHEQQRHLLRLKARQEKAKPVFKVGAREICQAAQAMHQRFVSLNTSSKTVLAEARAAGWLHFRPDGTGSLQLSSSQAWAAPFTEGSSRMGPEFRQNRDTWVVDGKVVALTKADLQAVQAGPDPHEQEGSYFELAGDLAANVLEVEAEQDLLSVEEQLQLEAALLHPSQRSHHERLLANLALTTSQTPHKGKKPLPAKETRAEKVKRWQAALGGLSLAARLAQLQPSTRKAKKQARKAVKMSFLGKTRLKWKKAKQAQKAAKAMASKAASKEASLTGPWVGKTVCCIAANASRVWQNSICTVVSQDPHSQQLTLQLAHTTTKRQAAPSEVAEVKPGWKAGMSDRLDFRRLTNAQKQEAWTLAGGEVQQSLAGANLEGPELSMGWMDILLRGRQTGDRWAPDQVVYLEPHGLTASLHIWEQKDEARLSEVLPSLQQDLRLALTTDSPVLIVVPVQGAAPDHWTALTYLRQPGSKAFSASHFDSLGQVHANCRSQAESIHQFLLFLGLTAEPELGLTQQPVLQTDGWSCGYHCLNRLEELYRQFRGEGQKRVYTKIEDRRQQVNRFAASTKEACSSAAAKAAAKAAAAKAAPLGPPPLPPPASDPPPLLPQAGLPKAAMPSGVWGCSRCKFAQTGCLSCCPEKMLRHACKQ